MSGTNVTSNTFRTMPALSKPTVATSDEKAEQIDSQKLAAIKKAKAFLGTQKDHSGNFYNPEQISNLSVETVGKSRVFRFTYNKRKELFVVGLSQPKTQKAGIADRAKSFWLGIKRRWNGPDPATQKTSAKPASEHSDRGIANLNFHLGRDSYNHTHEAIFGKEESETKKD